MNLKTDNKIKELSGTVDFGLTSWRSDLENSKQALKELTQLALDACSKERKYQLAIMELNKKISALKLTSEEYLL